ncbi:MAG: GTPase [bacterium]|nr:GTPase [bacterium]
MDTIDQQIEAIQEVLRKTPHHKATNGFIGQMRAKIARLKDKQIDGGTPLHQGSAGRTVFAVRKQGDATIVLIGPPSAGKSTLINQLTNAESKVAPYAFTTVTVVPGMLKYNEAYIQILDIPGLIEGAKEGRGRGREVLSVARGADLLVIMTDVKRSGFFTKMVKELEGAGIRINQTKPDITIEKKTEGGLEIQSNLKQEVDKEMVKEIAREYGIKNGIIKLKEKITLDRLFDAFSISRVYVPAIFVINKIDLQKSSLKKGGSLGSNYLYISADNNIGLDDLLVNIWKNLRFVTVYLVRPDEEPNFNNPIVMKENETLKDVAVKIGTDFADSKKLVKIWGSSAKFPGQEVSLTTKVTEGMLIRFL